MVPKPYDNDHQQINSSKEVKKTFMNSRQGCEKYPEIDIKCKKFEAHNIKQNEKKYHQSEDDSSITESGSHNTIKLNSRTSSFSMAKVNKLKFNTISGARELHSVPQTPNSVQEKPQLFLYHSDPCVPFLHYNQSQMPIRPENSNYTSKIKAQAKGQDLNARMPKLSNKSMKRNSQFGYSLGIYSGQQEPSMPYMVGSIPDPAVGCNWYYNIHSLPPAPAVTHQAPQHPSQMQIPRFGYPISSYNSSLPADIMDGRQPSIAMPYMLPTMPIAHANYNPPPYMVTGRPTAGHGPGYSSTFNPGSNNQFLFCPPLYNNYTAAAPTEESNMFYAPRPIGKSRNATNDHIYDQYSTKANTHAMLSGNNCNTNNNKLKFIYNNHKKQGQNIVSPRLLAIGLPRGPPQKPLTTDFALWVGNLPQRRVTINHSYPMLNKNLIVELNSFSKSLKTPIESTIFLNKLSSLSPSYKYLSSLINLFQDKNLISIKYIEKSGCAIINYKDGKTLNEKVDLYSNNNDDINRKRIIGGRKIAVRIKKDNKNINNDNKIDNNNHDGFNNNSTVKLDTFYNHHNCNIDHHSQQDTDLNEEVPLIDYSSLSGNLSKNQNEISLRDLYDEEIYEDGETRDCFFIIKSLTNEDLISSVVSGVWQTQSHNVEKFNRFFNEYDNVYFIFSTNKSGEYFGYARMEDEIPTSIANFERNVNNDVNYKNINLSSPFATTVNPVSVPRDNSPRIIYTPELINLPSGRIVDDSERVGFFWEVCDWKPCPSEDTTTTRSTSPVSTRTSLSSNSATEISSTANSLDLDVSDVSDVNNNHHLNSNHLNQESGSRISKFSLNQEQDPNSAYPFTIKWIKPNPDSISNEKNQTIPFHLLQNIKNSFNNNKEVKIARDGTRIDKNIGRFIVDLFEDNDQH